MEQRRSLGTAPPLHSVHGLDREMTDSTDVSEDEQTPRFWRKALSTSEGKVFVAGMAFVACYLAALGLASSMSHELFGSLWTMTGSHVIGGRFAGMLWGYEHQLPHWLVIVANMAIETCLVLLFYPLFVFSYSKLIIIEPLRETMARTQKAAEAHHRTLVKFGVPGLLLFVWFPFWMTGPLIGCVIGFLIGLRPWVNLATVLLGTYFAIFCWGLVLRPLHHMLQRLGPYVPIVFVGLILLIAVSVRIRYAFVRHTHAAGAGKDDR